MKKIYTKIKFVLICAVVLSVTNLMGQNLLLNPSFESGILPPWTAGNDNTVNIVEDPQDGTYAANGNIEQIVSLVSGKEYTYTGYVKNHTPDMNVWAGVKDLVGDALVTNYKITSSDYEKATITFTAANTGDFRFWVWGVADTDYTSDNFVLLEKGTTVGISETELDESIEISATQNGVVVKIDSEINNGTISVFDLSGRKILSRTADQGTTVIENGEFTTSGIYVVTVQVDRAITSEKVMISK